MAALTAPSYVEVRAPRVGEGRAIAALWRELWDVHESWGGYPGSKSAMVYETVASRIDRESHLREGRPVLGRHIHLVATQGGMIAGQVEGWVDRFGWNPVTPASCEVRSLVVHPRARTGGVGRALLDELGNVAYLTARALAHPDNVPSGVVLAAEVLEPNPAQSFYLRVGYMPVAWTVRVDAASASRIPSTARLATSRDALPIALLEATLASRRRAANDARFDPPRSPDAAWVSAIAAHLARDPNDVPVEVVGLDDAGAVRAAASFTAMTLDPPFAGGRRALLHRTATDPAADPQPLLWALIELGRSLARKHGAPTLEIADLTPPGTALYETALRMGAVPWSRIVTKVIKTLSP